MRLDAGSAFPPPPRTTDQPPQSSTTRWLSLSAMNRAPLELIATADGAASTARVPSPATVVPLPYDVVRAVGEIDVAGQIARDAAGLVQRRTARRPPVPRVTRAPSRRCRYEP